MTNKFRRSMTSVLLAASLLFSSQSVIAFADYGSKSDTSDLSPVQESVETVVKNEHTTSEETEESKEEPTTSKETEEKTEESTEAKEEPTTSEETEKSEQPAPAAPAASVVEAPVAPLWGHGDGDKDKNPNTNTSWQKKVYIKFECEECHKCDKHHCECDDDKTFSLEELVSSAENLYNITLHNNNEYIVSFNGQALADAYHANINCDCDGHIFDEFDGGRSIELKWYNNKWHVNGHVHVEVHCNGKGGETGEIDDELQKAIDLLDVIFNCDKDFLNGHGFTINLGRAQAQLGTHYTVSFNDDKTEATISIQGYGEAWMNVYNTNPDNDQKDHYLVKIADATAVLEKQPNGSWREPEGSISAGDFNITITCKEPDPTTPEKPDAPKLDKLLGNVSVVCDTAPKSHNTSYSFKDLSEGAEYTVTEPTPIAGQKDTYQCTVTVNDEKVLEKYNGETGTHTLAGTGSNLGPVTLTWKNNEWTVDNAVKDSLTVKIHCESEPWTPIVPFPTDDNIKALLDGKIKVVCETVKAHGEKTYGAEIEGGYTPSNEIKVDGTNYTYDLTINYNPYVAQYNDDDTSAKHGLVEPDVFSETVTLTWVPNNKELTGGHWAIDDDLLVTIPVQCEYPTLDQDDLANLWVNFFCINDEAHNKDHWTNLASCTAETDYHIEYDKDGFAEVTLLNPEQFAKTYCDSTLKVPHLYVGYEPESLELHWNGENWVSIEGPKSTGADSFTIGILCGPSIARINELLNAQIICVNDDAKHQKTASFDNLLDYSFDVTNLKNDNSVVTAEVVVKPSLYLDKFYNISGGIEHSVVIDNETYPVNEDGSVTVRFSYTGEWNLLYPTRNMVTFPVKCTTQKPIDNPDWEDISALFNDYVTVDCTTGGHNPISYSLVESEVQIGNVYSAAPIVGEESTTYFVPITFNTPDNIRNRVISAYDNSTPNTHSYQSGSIPASITLRYDNENKVWVNEDVKNVLFTVTCTTGGGTIDPNPNPGGGGDNDDDDDRYTGGNTVTRTINDDDVPLNDRPNNTTTIDDEDVPLADLPDDTVTIDDGEVPLKDNPSTGDSLPFAAMAAAALSLGGVIVLNRKKK